MQLTKLNDAMSKLKKLKRNWYQRLNRSRKIQSIKTNNSAPDTKPIPQPEGKKPSVPDINQEKEKAKLAVATYMSKILDDIQKHHLQKENIVRLLLLLRSLMSLKSKLFLKLIM